MEVSALSKSLLLPLRSSPSPLSPLSHTNTISFPSSRSPKLTSLTCSSLTGSDSSLTGSDSSSSTLIEKRFPSFPTVLDINQIREILPHRFPFLLVDRVIEHNPGVSAVAIKNVTINDNFFTGHFPERPIMPGVLMVEALAQVGGLVMLKPGTDGSGSKQNFFFVGIDKVRFRKPVVAGDTLVMRMTLVNLRYGIGKMEGKAFVGGEVVCQGQFLIAPGGD